MRAIIALTILLPLPSLALADEQPVPAGAAKPLFLALTEAFPEVRAGFPDNESIFIEKFSCSSNNNESRCTGNSAEGKGFRVEGGAMKGKLNALWNAMAHAGLPIISGETASAIDLAYIACDHVKLGSGEDSYECGYLERALTK